MNFLTSKEVRIDLVDSVLLRNESNIPIFCDFDENKELFLSMTPSIDSIYMHDVNGDIISSTFLPSEGPNKITQVVNIVFDREKEDIVILTLQDIVILSLDGSIKKRCRLDKPGILNSGFDSPRIIPFKNYYIISLLNEDDASLAIGSQEFIESASSIKFINKESCICDHRINYPVTSRLYEGIFQPTFYEPMMTLDKKRNELKFVFPFIEPVVYRYDLDALDYKSPIILPITNLIFPKSVEWNNESILKSKFQHDHSMSRLFNIIDFEGNIIVSYKENNAHARDKGNSLYYIVVDAKGNSIGEFHFSDDSQFDYLISHRNEKTFFAFPNLSTITSEPEGYPLDIVEIYYASE